MSVLVGLRTQSSHPYRVPNRTGLFSRDEWLDYMVRSTDWKPKPPAWWVRSQNEQGRTGSAPYAIWARSYKPERKYVIWDQAPDEDWREHGYLT